MSGHIHVHQTKNFIIQLKCFHCSLSQIKVGVSYPPFCKEPDLLFGEVQQRSTPQYSHLLLESVV